MSLYTIADLHLSLDNNKQMDIFSGWENYVQRLEKNWRAVINDDDTIVIVGDISWAMKLEETKKDFEFINNLPGKKIFIKGNHDYWWLTKSKIENYLKENFFGTISILFNNSIAAEGIGICGTRGWMYDSKTDEDIKIMKREAARLRTSIDDALKNNLEPIVFLHYPPVYDFNEAKEIMDVLIEKKIKKCYYGHIHGGDSIRKIVSGNYKGIDLKLISGDYLKFMPELVINKSFG